MSLVYDNETANIFIWEVENAGYEPDHYRGRFFWRGPAVCVEEDEYEDLVRQTSMDLCTDNMGLRLVVYPREEGGEPVEWPDKTP